MTTPGTQPVAFNPFEPGFFEDPYSQYRLLREREPVHHSELGFWVLFRYADVVRVLRDPAMSVQEDNAALVTMGGPAAELFEQLAAERPVSQASCCGASTASPWPWVRSQWHGLISPASR